MSKSKGNVINPLEVVDKYGADALRFALVVRSSPGIDKSIGEGDFKAARNLTNKVWNAARFIKQTDLKKTNTGENDRQFSAQMQEIITTITQLLADYKPGTAADYLYDQFWHFFCDQAIEWVKQGSLSAALAQTALLVFLKLWHPFIPFVTEQIWSELGTMVDDEKVLAIATWPVVKSFTRKTKATS